MSDKFITQIFKESYKAKYDKNKLINNLANYGGSTGTNLFVNRNGEYNGIVIELEERVYPLFTDHSVHSIYLNIESNYTNNMILIEKFNLVSLFQKYSNELFRFIVDQFLISNNAQPIYSDYSKIISNIKSKEIIELKTRINSDTNTLIPCKIKVVSCGELLPEDWIGKIFESGESFHRAIDELEARINKPPVTYLANYCMEYVKENKILDIKNLDLDKISNVWVQDIKTSKFIKYLENKLDSNLDSYIEINCFDKPVYIVYSKINTFNLNITKLESNSVGFNVSLMQKSFRRGPETYENLVESIEKLSKTKPYNNPEHQYELMSGSRQLFWRFNISVIEDVQIYQSAKFLDIFDLVIYAYIFGQYPKYVIHPDITSKLIEVGKLILSIEKYIDFRNWKEDTSDLYDLNCRYQISLGIGNKYMRGMNGDKKMIRSLLTWIKSKPKLIDIDSLTEIKKTDELYKKIGWYAGLDLHTNPQMIVQFQNAVYKSCKNNAQINLESCSKIIWDYSSSYNYRKISKLKWKKINDLIYLIQYIWINPNPQITYINLSTDFNNKLWGVDVKLVENLQELIYKKLNVNIEYSKLKFKQINNIYNVVKVSQIGQTILSSQIKNNFWYKNKKTYPIYTNEQLKFKHLDEIIDSDSEFYVNIFNSYTKYLDTLEISFGKLIYKTKYIDSHIYINDIPCIKINQDYSIEYKDTIYNLETKKNYYECDLSKDHLLYGIIDGLINGKFDEINTYINYKSIIGLQCEPEYIINTELVKLIPGSVKQLVLSRVLTSLEDKKDRITLIIGCIDRSGKASGDSVDSILEGYLMRVFNIFAILYGCFERVSEYKFIVKTKSNIFGRWLEDMDYNLKNTTTNKSSPIQISNKQIIKTKLWNHQIKVRDMIYNGIIKYNQRGFGDASEVGSGKTLTTLSCIELIDKLNSESNYLILVPNTNLYKVWEDEISTHCDNTNITCYLQEANGSWKTKLSNNSGPKLWITTMGRNRDHQLVCPLAWVVIDECLSVQNKESKWTIKAFEQVVRAKYGVLMLSATFFRTRFDKLFFMLKMLCTGLPTKSEYLDTILNTVIGANIKTNRIEWVTSIHKIKLDEKFYKGYDENKVSDKFESYIKLKKYLDLNVKFEEIAEEKVNQLLKLKRKILLYVESESQLENFKQYVELKKLDWGFYPDINKQVCVISKHKGTYGINNLIGYDTILIKPPEPDKLPQIKGRLDRPGQKGTKLFIEYIVIADTIEEIDLVKLELSNNFYRGHIVPLANYYDKYC